MTSVVGIAVMNPQLAMWKLMPGSNSGKKCCNTEFFIVTHDLYHSTCTNMFEHKGYFKSGEIWRIQKSKTSTPGFHALPVPWRKKSRGRLDHRQKWRFLAGKYGKIAMKPSSMEVRFAGNIRCSKWRFSSLGKSLVFYSWGTFQPSAGGTCQFLATQISTMMNSNQPCFMRLRLGVDCGSPTPC